MGKTLPPSSEVTKLFKATHYVMSFHEKPRKMEMFQCIQLGPRITHRVCMGLPTDADVIIGDLWQYPKIVRSAMIRAVARCVASAKSGEPMVFDARRGGKRPCN